MFARKKDILIILGILLTAAAIWGGYSLLHRAPAQQAVIQYDGKIAKTVSLSENQEFSLTEDPTVHFRVKDGAIAFVNSSCPDKICEQTGFLSKSGQTAACLPKKVLLKVVGSNKQDVDTIAN